MNILGENIVKLVGKITYREANIYNDSLSFKCKLAIPINDKFQYVKVSAWGKLAEALAELPNGTYIKIFGHIEETSFETKCKYCQGPSRVYWTNVAVDNFIVLD